MKPTIYFNSNFRLFINHFLEILYQIKINKTNTNGVVRICCQDWSSITENEGGWIDEGRVDISTKTLMDWLTIAN